MKIQKNKTTRKGMKTLSAKTGGMVLSSLLAVACIWFAGCAAVGTPGKKETSAIQQNKKTVVLLRVICQEDVQVQPPPTCDFEIHLWRLNAADGHIETSPAQYNPSLQSLSKSTRQEGWRYVVIDPGTYCVQVTPKLGANPISGDTSILSPQADGERPLYYLSVPSDKHVVYAGTVVYHRQVRRRGKHWPNTYNETEYTRMGLQDDLAGARQASGSVFDGLGEMSRSLMVSYDCPGEIAEQHSSEVRNAGAPGVATGFTVEENDTGIANAVAAPVFYTGLFTLQGASGASGKGGAYAAAVGLALILAAAPVALATEAITAEEHRKKWAPYHAALQKEFNEFRFVEKLQTAFAAQLGRPDTNAASSAPFLVDIEPYRLTLRGNEHQQFALEVAVQVRVTDRSERVLWEHDYVHAPEPNEISETVFETSLHSSNSLHRLEDYRGESGAELFRTELNSAVRELSEQIAVEFQCRSHNVEQAASIAGSPPSEPVSK